MSNRKPLKVDAVAIEKVDLELYLTDEYKDKIEKVDKVNTIALKDKYDKLFKDLIFAYDKDLQDLCKESEPEPEPEPTKVYTNPYHPSNSGCTCKTCALLYRIIEREPLTADDIFNSGVSPIDLLVSLNLSYKDEKLTKEQFLGTLSYINSIISK